MNSDAPRNPDAERMRAALMGITTPHCGHCEHLHGKGDSWCRKHTHYQPTRTCPDFQLGNLARTP